MAQEVHLSRAFAASPQHTHCYHRAMTRDNPQICRWGVLGTAWIAQKTVSAMHAATKAEPAAIASRDLARAEAFGAKNQLEQSFGAYDALLADPSLHAIYIPLPTSLHREWANRAAEAGKHVLCEKPLAPSVADASAMIDACAANNVQLMDGVTFVHHARLQAIKAHLSELGDHVEYVASAHSFKGTSEFFKSNIRVSASTEPLGAIGDLGWYNVRLSIELAGGACPGTVRCVAHRRVNGVPTHATAELVFPDGMVSTFHCSFHHPRRQWAEACGDRGVIRIRDFVHNTEPDAAFDCESAAMDANAAHVIRTIHAPGMPEVVQMIDTFSTIALGHLPVDPAWPHASRCTQLVVDGLMRSAASDGARVEIPAGDA